jgi:hypothetical protein
LLSLLLAAQQKTRHQIAPASGFAGVTALRETPRSYPRLSLAVNSQGLSNTIQPFSNPLPHCSSGFAAVTPAESERPENRVYNLPHANEATGENKE